MDVQSPRIVKRAAKRCDAILVDRYIANVQVTWSHVADRHGFAIRVHSRIVVGHRGADRVGIAGRARRIVVQIPMRQCEGLVARRAGAERVLFDVVRRKGIAPVDIQGEGVQRARVDDGAGESRNAVFADRGDRIECERGRDVVHGHGQAFGRRVDINGSRTVPLIVVAIGPDKDCSVAGRDLEPKGIVGCNVICH